MFAWLESLIEHLVVRTPVRDRQCLAASAARGDAPSAFHLGEIYRRGDGVPAHWAAAARWYLQAAEAGHVTAQCRLAQLHLAGLSGAAAQIAVPILAPPPEPEAPDFAAAHVWANRAAQAGDAGAHAMLGYIFAAGPESLRDPAASYESYRQAAAGGQAEGQLGYAMALLQKGEMAPARAQLHRAAKADLPAAHYLLGLDAQGVFGLVADLPAARRHYTVAAEAGLAPAQCRLGLMLLEGKGGRADAVNGETWLRRAALGGDNEAACVLGTLYAQAGPLPPNHAEAAHWWRLAAERGHPEAARALGYVYLSGNRYARDPEAAASWFARAAAAGDAAAMFGLGIMLAGGYEVAPDHAAALHWLSQAALRGHERATAMLV